MTTSSVEMKLAMPCVKNKIKVLVFLPAVPPLSESTTASASYKITAKILSVDTTPNIPNN
ncbi:hypothetical protein [Aerococcus urinaeequi]|uniref:hypothetical protein n=1 Tax=Aerococcus urinaeequi TaxID=51665 RepID=UPI003EDB4C12